MTAYAEWIAAGQPYTRARPTLQLRDLLRGHGYTVFDYPNVDHLKAIPPEDHTPYSATGWPITSKRWVGHAIDIMPSGPVDLVTLALQIIRDKDAGVPGTGWIKYINWTDAAGRCWHTSWQPTKQTVASSDRGHIHVSARSDKDTSDEVSSSGWDPVEEIMSFTDAELAQLQAAPWQYAGRGIGENNGTTVRTSMLAYMDEILHIVRALNAAVPADLSAQLGQILAAAQDDGDTTVVLPPDAITALQQIQDAIALVPTAQENAQATIAEIAS
jgi:hypothetical protein